MQFADLISFGLTSARIAPAFMRFAVRSLTHNTQRSLDRVSPNVQPSAIATLFRHRGTGRSTPPVHEAGI